MGLVRRYRDRIAEALGLARGMPTGPSFNRFMVLAAAGVTCTTICTFLARNDREYRLTNEGGPQDLLSTVFLLTAAMLAWAAWYVGDRKEAASWFWLLSAVALLVLTNDDRFQFHERFHWEWRRELGKPPFGMRNWNDVAVSVYGIVALGVAAISLPAVLRFRIPRRFLILGFISYAIHTAIDVKLKPSAMKNLLEETMKLFSGAYFVLAYLHALYARRAANPLGSMPRTLAIVTVHGMFALLAGSILWLTFADPREMSRNWGEPSNWFAATLFGSAAVLAWIVWLRPTDTSSRPTWIWLPVSVIYLAVAFDTGFVACIQVAYPENEMRQIPKLFSPADHLFGGPLEVGLALLVFVGLAGAWFAAGGTVSRKLVRTQLVAAAVFMAGMTVAPLLHRAGRSDAGSVGLFLFVLSGASTALAMLTQLIDRVLADADEGSVPP